MLELLAAGTSILGGLAGLKKQKPLSASTISAQTAAGIDGQAKGARDAGKKYGFNPLTLLGLGGAGVGSMGAGGPPLASFDMISNGLRSIQDERSGANEQRRVRAAFETDLLRLEVDRLKSGGSVRVGNGAMRNPSRGNRSTTGVLADGKLGMAPNTFAPGREKDVVPVSNTPGLFEIENAFTGGPISVPGDNGEPWGFGELATVALVGVPQVLNNHFSNSLRTPKTKDGMFMGGSGYTSLDRSVPALAKAIPRPKDKPRSLAVMPYKPSRLSQFAP